MGIVPVDSPKERSNGRGHMLDEAQGTGAAEGEYVDFMSTGAPANGAYHCAVCGYGVTVHATLPRCPMCGGTAWEPADWTALTSPQLET
jgi:rubredoxin